MIIWLRVYPTENKSRDITWAVHIPTSQVCELLQLLRTPFTTEGEDSAFAAAVARGKAAESDIAPAGATAGATAVSDMEVEGEGAVSSRAAQAVAVGEAGGDDYDAAVAGKAESEAGVGSGPAGSGPEKGAQVCSLVRKYDGKPPAWAAKLCVTCSS